MRIGIDARLVHETGVGRYIRNLIAELSVIDSSNEYVVFLRKNSFESFVLPNKRWQKRLAEVRWHTVAEQLIMPGLLREARLDLVHVPYHNPPVFYPGTMVVTIHDLTILHFATGKATTLPRPLYQLKRLGYFVALMVGLNRVKNIIAVSHATKREIMDHFRIPSERIAVTYEGVDDMLTRAESRRDSGKISIPKPYFLYVGNAYPHKNLSVLLAAFKKLTALKASPDATLVFVGKDNFFYQRLKEEVRESGLSRSIRFFGPANDRELRHLYRNAAAFVFPSLMEGFGLPALEALSLGCPVIASNISVFHEILGEYVRYIDPLDATRLSEELSRVLETEKNPTPEHMRELRSFLKQYSWKTLARETLEIYERSARV